MSNKSFSFYSSEYFSVEVDDQLIIEIAKSHIALVVTRQNTRSIVGFELFNYAQNELVKELWPDITNQSRLLSSAPTTLKIYVNNELCVPIPIFKFNKEIAADYLSLVLGEDSSSKVHFEHVAADPGIMNAYRVPEEWHNYFGQNFQKLTFHHTYSNIIKKLTAGTLNTSGEVIYVQFYNTSMIVAVLKSGILQLIQTFPYETPEDVLYYLLSITKQFQISTDSFELKISGLIDPNYKLYRELITYFKEVTVENVDRSNLSLVVGDYPSHYFTPFFNLAL